VASVPQPARLFDDSFLKILPAPLREPRRAWLAIPIAVALTLSGSLVISLLLKTIAPELTPPDMSQLKGMRGFLALDLFAPFVETVIMAGFLALFLRFMSAGAAVATSAIGWGIAHGSQAIIWGPVIAWPFLIFSTLYVVWRQRGFWPAVGVAATTHMLHNAYPSWVVAFG
jgi:hypothetical protein